MYELVIAARQAGIDAVRPGVKASEVHRATPQVIVEVGYGDWFRHRTGHCVGLDVHEKPFISPEDDTPLEAGMNPSPSHPRSSGPGGWESESRT